jgi:hypothetical protein
VYGLIIASIFKPTSFAIIIVALLTIALIAYI